MRTHIPIFAVIPAAWTSSCAACWKTWWALYISPVRFRIPSPYREGKQK